MSEKLDSNPNQFAESNPNKEESSKEQALDLAKKYFNLKEDPELVTFGKKMIEKLKEGVVGEELGQLQDELQKFEQGNNAESRISLLLMEASFYKRAGRDARYKETLEYAFEMAYQQGNSNPSMDNLSREIDDLLKEI